MCRMGVGGEILGSFSGSQAAMGPYTGILWMQALGGGLVLNGRGRGLEPEFRDSVGT